MLVFLASRRNSAGNKELFQTSAKIFPALEQRLEDLQQTVSWYSRFINQLRADTIGQSRAELTQAPFVEQHL